MTLRVLTDFESRSHIDLTKVGGWRYASDPSTEVLCCGIAWKERGGSWSTPHVVVFNWGRDGADEVLRQESMRGVPLLGQKEFFALINGADEHVAHNIEFERALYRCKFTDQVYIPDDKWSCTAARARRVGLPGALGTLASVMGFTSQKDAEGHKVMLQLCKPRPAWKKSGKGDEYFGDAVRFAKNISYCAQDIRAEMEADDLLPELSEEERGRWVQIIDENTHGLRLDYELITRMKEVLTQEELRLLEVLRLGTGGLVTGVNSYPPMNSFMLKAGIHMEGWGADAVTKKIKELEGYCPEPQMLVLKTRQTLAKSSTKKLVAMENRIMADGFARENAIYAGAHTLRNTGVGIQVLNMPRGDKEIDNDKAVEAILTGNADAVRKVGPVHSAVSTCLRQTIIASSGKKLVAVDYSSVEARGVFWLAGQEDGLAVFRANADIYCEMAKEIYGHDCNKKDHPSERQLGKIVVLGCGYQMWTTSFLNACELQYGMSIGLGKDIDEDRAKEAILAYRGRWDKVPQLWLDMEMAAISAVQNPGDTYSAAGGKIQFRMEGPHLAMWLPSRRALYYPFAFVQEVTKFGKKKMATGYVGKLPMSGGKYGTVMTYGGKLTENACQAVCRDIMEHHKGILADRGYKILMSVYDEIVTEVNIGTTGAVEAMEEVMKIPPDYATGFPLDAEGWEGPRFKKG